MFRDMLVELCSELKLLSIYASKYKVTEIDDLRVEEAILISRLHLLSDHAQNLEVEQNPEISAARKEVPSIEQRSVNVPSQLLRDPSARTNHGWMIEVLSDLIAYSRDHDLPSISKHLEKALKNTHTNWGPEESASTGGGFGAVVSLENRLMHSERFASQGLNRCGADCASELFSEEDS